MRTRICVFGDLRVEHAGSLYRGSDLGSRKGRTLLALLATAPGRPHTAADIAEALWPSGRPDRPEATIASLVSRLRRLLGREVIVGGRAGYRLGDGPLLAVDLAEAARLVDEAERRASAGQPGLATAAAQSARALLESGPVLDGEPDADWLRAARDEQAALLRRARHAALTAALHTGDHRGARAVAETALADDPLDEHAARGLLEALAAAGQVGTALAAYEQLRHTLADQLGADPAPATRRLHEAILRGEPATIRAGPSRPARPALMRLAGRDAELLSLQQAWEAAVSGAGSTVVLAGPAGAGKTRLAEELAALAAATGGAVLTARCYQAERGLLLQPLVEAVGTVAAAWPPATIRAAAGDHADALARLVPELRPVLDASPTRPGQADVERRRAIEGLAAFLCALADTAPILLLLDDLHNAGWSSVELLHFLRTRIGSARLLIAATVREGEGTAALDALAGVTDRLDVGALPTAGVRALAAAAGRADLGDEIARRTRGHALFVVEVLRGLAEGTDLPESLQSAVLTRLRGLGEPAVPVLRAGAVLGATFEPALAADLSGTALPATLRACELAQDAGLLIPAGARYEFANDVLREVVYATTPAPTRAALHGRAVDLVGDHPGQVAEHATAVGDWRRAARARLLAAEQALDRFAAVEAAALADQAHDGAIRCGDRDLVARSLLVRGRAGYAAGSFERSSTDLAAAVRAARAAGDRRLEMIALKEQSHDVQIGLGRPPADTEAPMRECLRIAESLGARTDEADVLGRLTVLAVSRLDFVGALELGTRALRVGRAAGHRRALVFGLDALKAAYAYLGEADALAPVVAELEQLERADGDLTFLQWTVFESAVIPLVHGEVPAACARLEEAIELNRRSGLAPMAPFFLAHLAWLHRLAGDLDAALSIGASAVAAAREQPHAWWMATAASLHAATLLALGRPEAAGDVVAPAVAAVDVPGSEAYLLRCLGPLAAATGDDHTLARADSLLGGIRAPAGSAWLLGADTYLAVADAWQARGDAQRAAATLAPLRAAATRLNWTALLERADAVLG